MSIHDPKMEAHRIDAEIENARFLMDTCGLSLEMTARRLNVTQDALEKLLARHRG